MILIISFGVITVVSIVLFLLAYHTDLFYYDDEIMFWSGIAFSIFGCAFLISSIISGVHHSSRFKEKTRVEIQERLDSIQNTRESLEHKISSETYTVLEINAYNESVREYKTGIKTNHIDLNNPWINWFICPVYNEFAEDAVSYLYVK